MYLQIPTEVLFRQFQWNSQLDFRFAGFPNFASSNSHLAYKIAHLSLR